MVLYVNPDVVISIAKGMSDRQQTQATRNAPEVSAPEFLENLVARAEAAGASDIHLQMRGDKAEVAFRLDGVLAPVTEIPSTTAERVFGRVKFLARLKTFQDSLPQDGRINREEIGARKDLRVATYPTVTGEKIVLRLFDGREAKSLAEINFPDAARGALQSFLTQPTGMLLLTGPAGSGKTTTIYACLQFLATAGERHIITIEDPVEQIIPGVMQTEVNEARGLDYAKAARHLLRQDPQVLVIGEIRDEATAQIALRASLTGHLVITTLHAGSCRGVLERLLVLCPDHSVVATSVELILNQRLLRCLCPKCMGKRCGACLQTGYQGRQPVVEFLRLNGDARARVAARDVESLVAQPSLSDHARVLVQEGVTDESECRRVLG